MSHHQTPADQIKEEIDLDVALLLRSVKANIETVPKTGPGDTMLPELRLFGTLSTLHSIGDGCITVQLKSAQPLLVWRANMDWAEFV